MYIDNNKLQFVASNYNRNKILQNNNPNSATDELINSIKFCKEDSECINNKSQNKKRKAQITLKKKQKLYVIWNDNRINRKLEKNTKIV